MNRRVVLVALLLFGSSNATRAQPLEVTGAECFKNGGLVGWTSDLGLAVLEHDQWRPWPVAKGVLRLWRSVDGEIFAIGDPAWTAVQLPDDSGAAMRWTIPTDFGAMRFTSLDGRVGVVTHDRVYRLDPGGKTTDVAQTPIGASRQPLRGRAPEILVSQGKTVVCTGTSEREDDYVGGSCRESSGTYVYRVDFGEPFCCESDAARLMTPVVCGDAVISAVIKWATSPPHSRRRSQSQARCGAGAGPRRPLDQWLGALRSVGGRRSGPNQYGMPGMGIASLKTPRWAPLPWAVK